MTSTKGTPKRPPLTRIVATIGPASGDEDMVRRLIEDGVAVFRLNFSHGTNEAHAAFLSTIRAVSAEMGRPVAVLGDLPGPKIRVGEVGGDGIEVANGDEVVFQRETIRAEPGASARPVFSCNFERLIDDVRPGERLLVNDGAVRMLVVDRSADDITCRVTAGGLITSSKGINLPDTALSLDPLTERDRELVRWAVEHDLDFLALSFVEAATDVAMLRDLLCELGDGSGPCIRVVAKVERPQAVDDIEAIAQVADAIMVARGDLGVEMDIARVPVIQRQLVRVAQDYGTPCIVATQMLETMIQHPSPTRAEASDVAHAILDRVDAVMLSGETAVGRYPHLAVSMMSRIAHETERHLATITQPESAPAKLAEARSRTAALAHGAWTMSQDLDVTCIAVWSQHGGGARLLSQNDFPIPIIALSDDRRALRQMQLLRGVTPVHMMRPPTLPELTRRLDVFLVEAGWAAPGETVLILAGDPIGVPKVTNRLAVHTVGDPTSGFGIGG